MSSYQPIDNPEYQVHQTAPHQLQYQDDAILRMQQHDEILKKRVRRLRIGIRILAFACSAVVVSLMTSNLVAYYTTRNMTSNGIRAWPSQAKLWPTYVALGVSATSLILATMVLFAYCCGTKAANKVNLARTVLTVGMLIFTAALWALAAAGLQGTSAFDGVGSQSLWSATCDSTDQQHELFGHWINFSQICLEQEWGLVCSGIGIGLEGLTVITYIYVFLRMRHQRKLKNVKKGNTFQGPVSPPIYQEAPESPLPSPYYPDQKGYVAYRE